MREYMKSLGSVMMLISLANMLIPEGSIKKFASLAMGFMLITAALSAIPEKLDEISFSAEDFNINEQVTAPPRDSYRQQVMQKHCENLESLIGEKLQHGSTVKVRVNQEGEIIAVTLRTKGDESRAIAYIVSELKFPRGRIKIINEKN